MLVRILPLTLFPSHLLEARQQHSFPPILVAFVLTSQVANFHVVKLFDCFSLWFLYLWKHLKLLLHKHLSMLTAIRIKDKNVLTISPVQQIKMLSPRIPVSLFHMDIIWGGCYHHIDTVQCSVLFCLFFPLSVIVWQHAWCIFLPDSWFFLLLKYFLLPSFCYSSQLCIPQATLISTLSLELDLISVSRDSFITLWTLQAYIVLSPGVATCWCWG